MDTHIAIIGMAARFPGANDLRAYWHNLSQGVDSIGTFTRDELLSFGLSTDLVDHPSYVPRRGYLEGVEMFDSEFFGFNEREAALMDPQQRVFLECAWHALENAGCNPQVFGGPIGVFAGAGTNAYLINNLLSHRANESWAAIWHAGILNEKDYLATRVSYKLNLRGPSVTLQTACSTSLVAVHYACQSLLTGESEVALAGGVSVRSRNEGGYIFTPGMIHSPDGFCRAFDAGANGTVPGSGVGVVVLKRLTDALAARDRIRAVIRSTAINNDGASKVAFTAPSVDGQANVISEALSLAGVSSDAIGYVEAHGTGTELGDPIEIRALTQAFARSSQTRGTCAVGSVKPNIGHADTAAGVAGLIKTVLALENEVIPPLLNFKRPNERLRLDETPFIVSAEARPWQRGERPRLAGVSSFGVGGTNAHLILEEAPAVGRSGSGRRTHLLLCSANTENALGRVAAQVEAEFARHTSPQEREDFAFTLACSRPTLPVRRSYVYGGASDTVPSQLSQEDHTVATNTVPRIVFLFPGQGSQRAGMARDLVAEPIFEQNFRRCTDVIRAIADVDLWSLLVETKSSLHAQEMLLRSTSVAQAALYATEFALAQLLLHWGITPSTVLGHSLGEISAAAVSGVFSAEAGAELVSRRGLMQQHAALGTMAAVSLSEEELRPLLPDDGGITIAALNAPRQCVVAGENGSMERWLARMAREGVVTHALRTSHAFHSPSMEDLQEPVASVVRGLRPMAPIVPIVSSVTGDFLSQAQAQDPHYWGRQIRATVRFSAALQTATAGGPAYLLEVGPGTALTGLAAQHGFAKTRIEAIPMSPRPEQEGTQYSQLLGALGRLWTLGVELNWAAFCDGASRNRVDVPGYPFERRRHWIAPGAALPRATPEGDAATAIQSFGEPEPEKRETDPVPCDLEEAIVSAFASQTGRATVDPGTSFFEIGGDSLQAVQLCATLRQRIKVDVSPQDVLRFPTPARLAAALALRGADEKGPVVYSSSPLVELQRGSRLIPLVMVHPAGGHVLVYRDLVQLLGREQTVLGIQAHGLDGTAPLEAIDDMAQEYLSVLEKRYPSGPVVLGGTSSGGAVAYEMAQRMAAAGREVPLVVLIDTPGPGHLLADFSDDAELMAYSLHLSRGIEVAQALSDLRVRTPDEQLAYYVERQGRTFEFESSEGTVVYLRHLLRIFKSNVAALKSYRPRPFRGKLLYFRAKDRDNYNSTAPERAWIDLADGGIEIHRVSGNHVTINSPPHVAEMARCLESQLRNLNLRYDPSRTSPEVDEGNILR